MNLDLRNSPEDRSQRMLNAIEPGTVLPVHRHRSSSETVVCLRGHFEEYFYDGDGNLTDTIDMVPGGGTAEYREGAVAQPEVAGERDGAPGVQGRGVRTPRPGGCAADVGCLGGLFPAWDLSNLCIICFSA